MATETISLTGSIAWSKLYEPDTAFGATKWKLFFFPENDQEWDKIKKAGIQKKIKENNNPENNVPIGKYLEFSRDAFKVMKGVMVNFTGPIILSDDGKVIVDYINQETNKRVYSYENEEKKKIVRRGNPILLGNGTRARVSVAVYDTQKGKGQRLEQVQVLNLVEYSREDRELPPVIEDVRRPLTPVDKPAVDNGDAKVLPW